MRSLVLVLIAGACGGNDTSGPAVDGPAGSGDGSLAAFCDGTPHDVGPGIINAVAVDASGRLVAVGTQVAPAQTMVVWRLLATGALDASFGTAGTAAIATGGPLADGHAMAVRADGTIIAGGGVESPTDLKPFVVGLDDTGAPTGLDVRDPDSTDSTIERIELQGGDLVVSTANVVRRISAAGIYDDTFAAGGKLAASGPIAVSDSGLVTAVVQADSILTYRTTPDGANVSHSTTTVPLADAWSVGTTLSRADRITFIGQTTAAGGGFHSVIGRVLADNTADVASYPPSGTVDLGTLEVRTGVERADGSLVLAGGAAGVVLVDPDGTIDRMLALGADPAKWSLTAVVDWNGHPTAAGTLSGGRAFVACFP